MVDFQQRDLLYNQLNPIVRIEEGKLIDNSTIQKMLTAPDFQSSQEYLRQTVYGQYLDQVDFGERFEYYLRQEQGRLHEKIYQLAPEKEVVDIYTMRYTYHNLKLLTKAAYLGENLDQYLISDGKHATKTLKSAIANRRSASLETPFLESIQAVGEDMDKYQNPLGIDIIYDRHYLRHQRQAADKLAYPELTQEVISFIDLVNISTLIRVVKQDRSINFLYAVLSSYGSISKEELITYAKRPLSELVAFLQTTAYSKVIDRLYDQETGKINLLLMDKERDNYLTELYNLSSIQAFGPLPLLALLNAKDIECKNLQLILVGKKNNFTENEIEERMRISYGL